MKKGQIKAAVLDTYYRTASTGGYQIKELICNICDGHIKLSDAPKKSLGGDSGLGKVGRLRGVMRDHLRNAHSLQIALMEHEKVS